MDLDGNGLEILSRRNCLGLLAGQPIGRVAVSLRALPAILPVTYCLLGEDVVFATGGGSRSRTILDDKVIAFEVDSIDPTAGAGWSVLVVGTAVQVDEPAPDLRSTVHLGSWADGHAVRFIRLPTDHMSGRRLVAGGDEAQHPAKVAIRQ